ncbi:hypothetical protein BGX28_002888 [Mortierella sp. GBA30]|nr:hypothetical protein BGX28_002888 [Mortierella sp. GBA30]
MDSSEFVAVTPTGRSRSSSSSTLSSFIHISTRANNTSTNNTNSNDDDRLSITSSNFDIRSLPDSISSLTNAVPGLNLSTLSNLSDTSYLTRDFLDDIDLYSHPDLNNFLPSHPENIHYAFPFTASAACFFPTNLPPKVSRTIFSFLDRTTLHTTLTVSKGWFRYAAGYLYRDPFRNNNDSHSSYCGSGFVSPSNALNPADERKLIQLLLRSIGCPSEPGEKVVLICDESEGVLGSCRLADERGNQIRTSVNYIRFLEVFDWAPWQRYLDFWDSTRLALEEEEQNLSEEDEEQDLSEEGEEEARSKKVRKQKAREQDEDEDEDDENRSDDDEMKDDDDDMDVDCWIVKAMTMEPRKKKRVVIHFSDDDCTEEEGNNEEKDNGKNKGKGKVKDKEGAREQQCSAYKSRNSFFRFSYNTVLDWFAENPNARTIVVHPQMRFPFQIVPQLTRWTTLRFEECRPQLASPYKSYEYMDFNPAALLQGIFEHQSRSYTTSDGRTIGGIRHLQLPPAGFFDGESDHLAEVQTLVDVITRPASLDVSAFSQWLYTAMGIPDENLLELTRYVCLNVQEGFLSQQGFLRRCPNLREIEMIVRDSRDVEFAPLPYEGSYRNTRDRFNDNDNSGDDDNTGIHFWSSYSDQYRTVETYNGPLPPSSMALTVARLYLQSPGDFSRVLIAMQYRFNTSLRELRLDLAPLEYRTPNRSVGFTTPLNINSSTFAMPNLTDLHLKMCSQIVLFGEHPFGGCPRLQRLTLSSIEIENRGNARWFVPRSLKELTLDRGYDIRRLADFDHLHHAPELESLTFGSPASLSLTNGTLSVFFWPLTTYLPRLKTLKLSGIPARSFRFDWMFHCPALDTLEVDGLEYRQLRDAFNQRRNCMAEKGEEEGLQDAWAQTCRGLSTGPRVCKLAINNMDCNQGAMWGMSRLSLQDSDSAAASSGSDDAHILLLALKRYCSNVRHLTLDIRSCTCTRILPEETHPELDLMAISRLTQCLPSLTYFGTDSLKITGQKQHRLRRLGFVPRMDQGIMQQFNLPRDKHWEECAYRFGETTYQHYVDDD